MAGSAGPFGIGAKSILRFQGTAPPRRPARCLRFIVVMSEISKSAADAASFLAEAHRLRGMAAADERPWMHQALVRLAQGYEQLAALSECEAGASTAGAG